MTKLEKVLNERTSKLQKKNKKDMDDWAEEQAKKYEEEQTRNE